ncbi:MAG: hypothetical protein LBL83_00415, partial [Clostridiales bacterium]|nr:hypothetical protein [Clostridiales bacterium]
MKLSRIALIAALIAALFLSACQGATQGAAQTTTQGGTAQESGASETASPSSESAAASASAPEGAASESGASESAPPPSESAPASSGAESEPITVTIFYHDPAGGAYNDAWPAFLRAAEITGVTLKGTAPSAATNHDEVFNLMMASGELPDIVAGKASNLVNYGKDGAFVDLGQRLGENTPNINQLFS